MPSTGCPEGSCIKRGPHGWHSDGERTWPNETLQASVAAQQRSSRKPGRKTTRGRVGNWLTPGAEDEWVTAALDTVTEWLHDRREPFTTAEHFWPLLDAPPDMRVMRRVVVYLLRNRAIEEVDAKRLKGTYTTRDGQAFRENKLVPVYRSRLS